MFSWSKEKWSLWQKFSMYLTYRFLEPVAPPANVTLFNKTSTSILVTWDEVPYGKRKGQIQQYKVIYKAEKENSKSIEVNRSTHALKIINLKQNTHYNITVSAATVKGFGPSSEPISIFTGQDSEYILLHFRRASFIRF